MDIELREVTVAELVDGYRDDGDGGVVGYGGKLDIRPPFQREFVYGEKERNAVIDTVAKGFPLNVMYWADRGNDTYEIIDGQQRTISIAQYAERLFSHDGLYFHNLTPDKRDRILDYQLMVYVCSGTDGEKLDWFKTINIAGLELTNQELRNAVYAGSWVADAKRYFSSNGSPAYRIGNDYLNRRAKRQEYLETAIRWISQDRIEDYMGRHQDDANAGALWEHYRSVIEWVESVFTTRRSAMKRVDWGPLYDDYKDSPLDPDEVESETLRLIDDEEVTSQHGIYPYILTRDEKHLNIRTFPEPIKRRVYERQNGKCAICGDAFDIARVDADHITPWAEGGKTIEENCQILCRNCNQQKGAQ